MRCFKEKKVIMKLAEVEKKDELYKIGRISKGKSERQYLGRIKKHTLLQICQASSVYSGRNGILEGVRIARTNARVYKINF
jgi:hypothetical protein